jgi:hypothetical protein
VWWHWGILSSLWCPAALAFVVNVVGSISFSVRVRLGVHIKYRFQVFVRPQPFSFKPRFFVE